MGPWGNSYGNTLRNPYSDPVFVRNCERIRLALARLTAYKSRADWRLGGKT